MINVYISDDTTALSLFADEIADVISKEAQKRPVDINLTRKGSYGIFSYEPLIEIENKNGRYFIGPVKPGDIEEMFDGGMFGEDFRGFKVGFNFKSSGGRYGREIFFGETDGRSGLPGIPMLLSQKRLAFKRAGASRPLSLKDYTGGGGLAALKKVAGLKSGGERGDLIIEIIKKSGLRGRGGAGFPVWKKWDAVFREKSGIKYIVCNADEGDSGAFADRAILESDPFCVMEGMIIAGITVGAEEGYIYLRSEYANAGRKIAEAINIFRNEGLLGNENGVLNSGEFFNINLLVGGGSYVCGEETALLESMENRRGTVKMRPPVPAVSGLYGKPTVLNNVLTFAYATYILSPDENTDASTGGGGSHVKAQAQAQFQAKVPAQDISCNNNAGYFSGLGTEDSKGTMVFQLSGAVKHPGIYEMPMGITLKELLALSEGSGGVRRLKAVQIGGPLGAYFPVNDEFLNLSLSYECLARKGGILGHGGIVVFGESADLKHMLLTTLDFCIDESCGKCSPCRLGSTRIKELAEKVLKKQNIAANLEIIKEILEVMKELSLCGLGGMLHYPVNSLLKYFGDEILPET